MKFTSLLLGLLLPLAMLVGCSSERDYTYDISVKNDTGRQITVWLTKDGPPREAGWRSPEDLAMNVPPHEERFSGTLIPVGKTAYIDSIKGKFAEGTYAWLRVYDGRYDLSNLLAISRGNPKRADYPLDPGGNHLVVKDKAGKIQVLQDK